MSNIAAQVEGLLFALGRPLSRQELAQTLGLEAAALEAALIELAGQSDRGVALVDDGTAVELRTADTAAGVVERLRREELSHDLGRAGLEVLAAVLYRGPLSRSDIDFIRGVNSTQTLRMLTTRGLIRRIPNAAGNKNSFLFEPTTELLAFLGTTHPRDLPDFAPVRERLISLENSYREAQSES